MFIKNPIIQKIYKESKSRSGKTLLNKKPIGVLVAGLDLKDPTKICVGYSLCNKKDKFDYVKVEDVSIHSPGFGKKLAIRRAIDWKDYVVCDVPPSILKKFMKFKSRCKKYYKGAELPHWTAAPNQHFDADVTEADSSGC